MRAAAGRIAAIDGLRGVLAVVVMLFHFHEVPVLREAAIASVFAFFVLSGWVLAAGWDGRYGAFLRRRLVRLGPMYLICVGTGFVLMPGADWRYFLFFPPYDPPAWSMLFESVFCLLMPAFLWGRRHRRAMAGICGAIMAGSPLCGAYATLAWMVGTGLLAFQAGVWMAGRGWRGDLLERPLAQWLGRISYPLYLSHFPVVAFVSGPVALRLVLAFALAHFLADTVERWSIAASRRA